MLLVSQNGEVHRFHGDFGPRELVSLGKAATPQTRGMNGYGGQIYEELGRTGLRHWGGFVFEEWLQQLQYGRRAAEVYREMSDQDPVLGAIIYAIHMLIRRVEWWVEPQGSPQAKWFNEVLHDMRFSWEDTLSEILSFLVYGYSWHEMVFKIRNGPSRNRLMSSQFSDGTVALAKLPLRSQDSLWKWVFDDDNEIAGMIQNPPPDYLLRFIPWEKSLHFRTNTFKDNPEGRPLVLDCPVRTSEGWRTMETVEVGDLVYDETGQLCPVTGKSEVFKNRPVYEVEFSTGHKIKADACHEWSVTTTQDRSTGLPPRCITTEEMFEIQHRHLCCGMAPVLEGHEVVLPLDPYLLGYWLGDGSTTRAAFSVHHDDLPNLAREVERAGFSGKRTGGDYQFTVRGGLLDALREASVLGDKHIPPLYFDASFDQRLALLQGLMDSDGYAPGTWARDQASKFANTNLGLIEDVCQLVRSLGGQPRVRCMEKAGSKGGSIRGRVVTATRDVYEVSFYLNACVHRLPRKVARQTPRGSLKSCGHFIKSIRRVENADTVCIEVDSQSHLFLAGSGLVPTHNSILRNAYRSWWYVKNIQQIEAIGIERDLAGLPVLTPPEGTDIWDADDTSMAQMLAMAKNVVSSIRRDEQEGVVLPFGWTLELMASAGARQFDTTDVITRYETRMATSVLADLVMMGQDKVGSYALSVTKKDMFTASLGAYLDIVSVIFNTQCIPPLWALNGFKTKMPQLCHGSVETIDLQTISTALNMIGRVGAPIDWSTTLPFFNKQGGFPAASEGHSFEPRPISGSGTGGDEGSGSDKQPRGSGGEKS